MRCLVNETRGWEIRFTKQAKKDIDLLSPELRKKLRELLVESVVKDPFIGKRLLGDLAGSYSVRLTFQDRVIYSLDEVNRVIYVERARTHYGQ